MSRRRFRPARLVAWALALAALAFVVWKVPVRDRCWDPRAPASTSVTVTRQDDGCVLHLRTGEVTIGRAECAQLRCEPGLASTLSHASPGVLAALLAFYALGTVAWAARWRALLGFAGIEMNLLSVWRLTTEAQAGGILLPGGIGSDALRVAAILQRPTRPGEQRAQTAIVVASVLLDRAIGLSVIGAMAAALGFAWGGLREPALGLVLAAIPVGVASGLVVLRKAPLQRISWLVEGRLGRTVRPILEYVRDPRAPAAIARAALLSIAVAGVQFVTIRGLIYALGTPPTAEKWVYVGSAMSFIVGAVPAMPGGWGTTEAAYVFFLGLAGLSAGTALAVCLLYRMFWYLMGVTGAVLHVARTRSSPATAGSDPAGQPPA